MLLEPLPLPAFLWALESESFIGSNEAFRALFGYSEEEVLRLNWRDLIVSEEIKIAERAIKIGPEMQLVCWHMRKKDGSVIPVTLATRAAHFVDDAGAWREVYVGIVAKSGDQQIVSASTAFPE